MKNNKKLRGRDIDFIGFIGGKGKGKTKSDTEIFLLKRIR